VAAIFTVVSLGMFPINPGYGMIQNAIFDTVGGLGVASSYAWIYSITILVLIGIIYAVLKDKSKDEYVVDERKEQAEKEQKRIKRMQRKEKWQNLRLRKVGGKHGS